MPIFRRTRTVCYCTWCAALVLLDVVGSGCGALRCRVRALWRLLFDFSKFSHTTGITHFLHEPNSSFFAVFRTYLKMIFRIIFTNEPRPVRKKGSHNIHALLHWHTVITGTKEAHPWRHERITIYRNRDFPTEMLLNSLVSDRERALCSLQYAMIWTHYSTAFFTLHFFILTTKKELISINAAIFWYYTEWLKDTQLNSKRRLNTRQTVGCGIRSSLLALRVDLRGLRSKLSWSHLKFSSDTRKNFVLHSSHFALNWRCSTAVR